MKQRKENMQDLIISDEEFKSYSEAIGYLTQSMENAYSSIINQLRIVCETGVTEGNFHDNLSAYISSLEMMQGQMQYITNAMQRIAEEFIAEIDEIDQSIY